MGDRRRLLTRRAALVAGGSTVASVLAACSAPNSGAPRRGVGVAMSYDKQHLTGAQNGKRVMVSAVLPQSAGSDLGTFASKSVDAHWSVTYNDSSNQTVIPATLGGTVAGVPVTLKGTFNHAPNFLFESGTIAGTAGGSPVQARAQQAQGERISSVNVQGNFGGVPFTLCGTLEGNLASEYVQGAVGGKPFKVTALRKSQGVELTGDYAGPSDLLALIVGTLLLLPRLTCPTALCRRSTGRSPSS